MAETAEQAPHVARERAHIGALAALGLEHGAIRIGELGVLDQLEAMNLDRARFELDDLAVAREIVGALAVDLDGRVARRHLRDRAGEARQERADGRRRRTVDDWSR